MCLSALPPHLDTLEEIYNAFPDDSQYGGWWGRLYKWFRKETKAMTSFGPRDVHWYHRTRDLPITLFAIFGEGAARWEESNGFFAIRAKNDTVIWYWPQVVYLSRVQYWCDWHIQIQWPLFLNFHFWKWQGYVGLKRDADRVFRLALYFGRTWK